MPNVLLSFALSLSLSAGALAQASRLPCSPRTGNFAVLSTALLRTGIGTPYSLTAVLKNEMKLADGNTLSGFTTTHQARDSRGRTRTEQPSSCGIDKDGVAHWEGSVTVTDPTAKTLTTWQEWLIPSGRFATVMHSPSIHESNPPTAHEELEIARQVTQAFENGNSGVRYTVEDLGRRNIAGLVAIGMRVTRTSPVGMMGNSLPLLSVEEKWVSDQYSVILLDITDDPIFGKSSYEVTTFNAVEPDAAMFQPPAGFEVREGRSTQ